MQTQTATIKVVLSTSTFASIAERAKNEGVEPSQYCSHLLTNYLNDSKNILSSSAAKKHVPSLSDVETADVPRKLPSTIEQIFSVCYYVWREKIEFADALRKVAQKFNVGETTIRDKCTRRISLPHSEVDTARFVQMLNQPASLRDYLCHRFPKFTGEIIQRFESVMPPNFGAN